jgi:hypothetical protein
MGKASLISTSFSNKGFVLFISIDILDFPTRGIMCTPDVEKEIEKLGPETSQIYFDAKETLAREQDSKSESFSNAARIVRAFWKRITANRNPRK